MGEMKVWFDGKTQWSYNQANNEVSVTEPTEKELSETNPLAILSGFKSKCTIKFSGKTKSAQNNCIEMTPKVANKTIAKIEVQVNKTNGNLASIKTITGAGSSSLLTLNNFQKGLKVTDNIFTFNSSKYKGVTVNDLR
jgi:outer membrane lipoprotein-sorting protein